VQTDTFELTTQQRFRRSLYFTPRAASPRRTELKLFRSLDETTMRQQAKMWVTRELQALLLQEDVTLVLSQIMGCIEPLKEKKRKRSPPRPLDAAHRDQTRKSNWALDSRWLEMVADCSRPFLFENSEQFAGELAAFLDSGLTVAQYDALWDSGNAATQPGPSSAESQRQLTNNQDRDTGPEGKHPCKGETELRMPCARADSNVLLPDAANNPFCGCGSGEAIELGSSDSGCDSGAWSQL